MVPTALGRRKDIASLAYIVVDELESDFVGLTINAWPTLDDRGRLRFDLERSRSVRSTKQGLHAFLARHRTPARSPTGRSASATRSHARSGSLSRRVHSPTPAGGWFPHHRHLGRGEEAAKLAFFSAVAPIANRRRDPEVVRLAPSRHPSGHRSVSGRIRSGREW
jgi:hypothetical protein